jgi:hypothetical protein
LRLRIEKESDIRIELFVIRGEVSRTSIRDEGELVRHCADGLTQLAIEGYNSCPLSWGLSEKQILDICNELMASAVIFKQSLECFICPPLQNIRCEKLIRSTLEEITGEHEIFIFFFCYSVNVFGFVG